MISNDSKTHTKKHTGFFFAKTVCAYWVSIVLLSNIWRNEVLVEKRPYTVRPTAGLIDRQHCMVFAATEHNDWNEKQL